jgi:hypothetical protein
VTTQQSELLVLALLVATVTAWVLIDVWLYQHGGPEATISRVVRHWIGRYPSVFAGAVFALGVFVGHTWLNH